MDLVPLFQASLYIAVATAAITLAVAEEQGFPSLITLPVAALSFWLVERKKLWSLDDWSAAGLAVLALGFLVWEFQGEETLSRVLAGAHFLVFLTWIVLLQRKQIRQYWFLMALGWLQVAVAAVMTESPGFGVALFFYLLLAVWTLSLFALYQGVADLVGEGQLVSGATENAWGGAWKSARPDPQLTSPAVAQGQAPPRMVDAVTRPTRIRNVAHMRLKETDRVTAVVTELRRLGLVVDEHADGMTIHPGPLKPGTVATYDDHRMAMSFSLLGLRQPQIVIADPGCTSKTYPEYFADLETLCQAAR